MASKTTGWIWECSNRVDRPCGVEMNSFLRDIYDQFSRIGSYDKNGRWMFFSMVHGTELTVSYAMKAWCNGESLRVVNMEGPYRAFWIPSFLLREEALRVKYSYLGDNIPEEWLLECRLPVITRHAIHKYPTTLWMILGSKS